MTDTKRRIDDDMKSAARREVSRAFSLAGLVTSSGDPICPLCGTSTRGKVKLFADGGWYCYREGAGGDAIDVLVRAGWNFPDAVRTLAGEAATGPRRGVAPVAPRIAEGFRAVVDCEVYATVCGLADTSAAQAFYARFGISPAAVAEFGARVVVDPAAHTAELTRRFGVERLVACGVVRLTDDGAPRTLYSAAYPVIEPHRDARGAPCGLQFRGSQRTEERVAAHKAGRGEYVPKFLSLRGAGAEHLLGCGLPRLVQLPAGASVRIVEGAKDLLAARTLGWEAYALPGAGATPPPAALEVLSRHRLAVAFDGDAAGDAGAESLVATLGAAGIPTRRVHMPKGMDACDLLAVRRRR